MKETNKTISTAVIEIMEMIKFSREVIAITDKMSNVSDVSSLEIDAHLPKGEESYVLSDEYLMRDFYASINMDGDRIYVRLSNVVNEEDDVDYPWTWDKTEITGMSSVEVRDVLITELTKCDMKMRRAEAHAKSSMTA